jgi:phosphoribosylformylglycinamidine synthase
VRARILLGVVSGAYNRGMTALASVVVAVMVLAVAQPAAAFKVTVKPTAVPQGDVALIIVTGAATAPEMDGSVAGRPLFFFPYADGYAALIGMDLEAKPGRTPWHIGFVDGAGAPRKASGVITVKSRKFPVQRLTLPKSMVDLSPSDESRAEAEATRLRALYDTISAARLWHGRFTRPIASTVKPEGFGFRRIINGQPRSPHSGVDFAAPAGTPVVADVAVTLMDYSGYAGEAMAMGERTPLALIDAPASGRMTVGEAITNIAAAGIASLSEIKLSANWMAPAGYPGEDAALYDTVHAVAMELCPALGISIPVGKDSMSMRTTWRDVKSGEEKSVTAPLSLIVSAFAPVNDVRRTLTPELRMDAGDTELVLVDLGAGRNRLGGSALAQVHSQLGTEAPDLDDPAKLKAFFGAVQRLNGEGRVLAYHDRSDGGLLATLCEMAFASRAGVSVYLDTLALDPRQLDVDGHERETELLAGNLHERIVATLFNEELGAVLQVRRADRDAVMAVLREAGLSAISHVIGHPNAQGEVRFIVNGKPVFAAKRASLHRAWSEVTHHIQRLRDNPACADQEYERILDEGDPGLNAKLTFDPAEDIAAPHISTAARPRIAILREQGVNGQVEMAAAFDRAGFAAVDVHMSDIIAGRVSLAAFKGFAACGGFSYGDVLGAGEGWAKSILFNPRARDEFEAFFRRDDSFALGACNGCQMMSNLKDIIPGARNWPHFERNASEQYEARVALIEIQASPSILFQGMEGSRIPIATAHGEGRAVFKGESAMDAARFLVAARFVDNRGAVTEAYPYNPNGSPQGVTALTTPDGRFNILMPHPERVFRSVLLSWHPREWGEDSPWMRMFRNARAWVG